MKAETMAVSATDMARILGVSKPTIFRAIKRLDPNEEHITRLKRNAIEIDDYLSSLLSSEMTKDPELAKTILERGDLSNEQEDERPKIKGARRLHIDTGESTEEMKELYDRLAEVEYTRYKEALDAKDREIQRLELQNERTLDELNEWKGRAAALEEKLDATRAQLDTLNNETIKSLTTQTLPWWKKLFGRPKKND